MGGLILLSRVLGQIRDTIISYQFGQDAITDAYRAAFSIPDLLFFLIAGGALSSAFIPVFTKYWANGEEDEAWHVFSVMATAMGLIVLGFVVFAETFAEPLLNLVTPGLPPETIDLAATMSRIVLPSQFGFFLGGLMFGTMNARQHFLTPGLSPNIYNVGIIAGALIIAPFLAVPIFGLAWGALIGALVGSLVLPIFLMRRFGVRFRLSLNLKHPGVISVFKLMLPVVLGLSLPGVYAIALRFFASFQEQGTISALENGNRVMQAPLGIFGQALAIAVFPTLSALYAQDRAAEFLATLSKTVRTALFVGILMSALLFVLSEDVVRLLYQYGKFTAEDADLTAAGLRMFSIGVFAWCAHPVLMRAFFAMHTSLLPILLGTATSVIFALLCWGLVNTNMGYLGLPLATSISAIVLLVLLTVGLRSKLSRIDGTRLARLLFLGGASAIGTAALIHFVAGLFPASDSHLASLFRLIIFGLGGAWVYIGIGKLLGLEEAKYALTAILRRRGSAD
ncbi:MAG: murein biosynthesis integral membrane protein MurJ [Armatimonadetes bacterium]|nr:murein biosynthesis integral membrane protein MurJ [Armatimonadota bacterium]